VKFEEYKPTDEEIKELEKKLSSNSAKIELPLEKDNQLRAAVEKMRELLK
jgi:hypothetical protein